GQSQLLGSQRAMDTDSRPSTAAMRQPIASEDNLSSNANELTYNKGRAVLAMFEGWLGPEKFRAGVLKYIAAHEWANATGSDLWTALSEASGDDINAAMSSFLDQPGVPDVKVEDLGNGSVRLSQRRFDASGQHAYTQKWRVPVILTWPDGAAMKTQRAWLTDSTMVVKLDGGVSPKWIYPNAGASGYYGWNLPAEKIAAIAADRRRLAPIERVGFLRVLPLELRAGRIRADQFLELVGQFRDDTEPEVLQAAIAALEALRDPLVTASLAEPFAVRVRGAL